MYDWTKKPSNHKANKSVIQAQVREAQNLSPLSKESINLNITGD